jgi:hypothetical protein
MMKRIVKVILVAIGGLGGAYLGGKIIGPLVSSSLTSIPFEIKTYIANVQNLCILGFLIALGIGFSYEFLIGEPDNAFRFNKYLTVSLCSGIGGTIGLRIDILSGFLFGFLLALGFALADDLMIEIEKNPRSASWLCTPIYGFLAAFFGAIGLFRIHMGLGIGLGAPIIGGIVVVTFVIFNKPLGIFSKN